MASWPTQIPTDWDLQQKNLFEQQGIAVGEVFKAKGVEGIFGLAAAAKDPFSVGRALGGATVPDVDDVGLLERTLGFPDQTERLFGLGLVDARLAQQGAGWSEPIQAGLRWTSWRSDQKADYLLVFPFTSATWDRVESEGPDVSNAYWIKATWVGREVPCRSRIRDRATESLIRVGHLGTAVHLLSLYSRRLTGSTPHPELAVDLLERVSRGENRQDNVSWPSYAYNIGELLKDAASSGKIEASRLAQLEWLFLPLLRTHHSPGILERALADDPALFVQVLKFVYRGKSDEITEVSDETKARAMQGHLLLEAWKGMPGLDKDGRLDELRLREWVSEARRLATAADRTEVVDVYLGGILSRCPAGADGVWPHEAVRELIDELASDPIDRGFKTAVRNRRGMVRRRSERAERRSARSQNGTGATSHFFAIAGHAPRDC